MKSLLAGAALALCACVPLAAAQTPAPPAPGEEAQLKNVVARGVYLYGFDRAAWVSTDVMKEKIPARLSEVRGWVVEGDQTNNVVTYYGDKDGTLYRIFVVTMANGKATGSQEIAADGPDRTLSPMQARMAQARKTAIQAAGEAKVPYCAAASPNTVIMPAPGPGGPIDVYIMTPQTKANVWPFGGHSMFRIGADGKVASSRVFTRGCLDMAKPEFKKGETVQAMMVTHLLDPTPTELHVFLSLSSGMPVAVATTGNNTLWMVQGTKITKSGTIPALPKP